MIAFLKIVVNGSKQTLYVCIKNFSKVVGVHKKDAQGLERVNIGLGEIYKKEKGFLDGMSRRFDDTVAMKFAKSSLLYVKMKSFVFHAICGLIAHN